MGKLRVNKEVRFTPKTNYPKLIYHELTCALYDVSACVAFYSQGPTHVAIRTLCEIYLSIFLKHKYYTGRDTDAYTIVLLYMEYVFLAFPNFLFSCADHTWIKSRSGGGNGSEHCRT